MQSSATPMQKNANKQGHKPEREKQKRYNRQALREAKRQG